VAGDAFFVYDGFDIGAKINRFRRGKKQITQKNQHTQRNNDKNLFSNEILHGLWLEKTLLVNLKLTYWMLFMNGCAKRAQLSFLQSRQHFVNQFSKSENGIANNGC
jgi:hypothetical protein